MTEPLKEAKDVQHAGEIRPLERRPLEALVIFEQWRHSRPRSEWIPLRMRYEHHRASHGVREAIQCVIDELSASDDEEAKR